MSKRLSGQQPEHDGYGKPAGKKTKANNADPDGSITAIVTANDSSQGKVGQPKKAIQLDAKLVKVYEDAKIMLATARKYKASEKQINADLKEHFKQDLTKGLAIRDHAVAKIKQDREKTGFLKNTFDEKLQEVKDWRIDDGATSLLVVRPQVRRGSTGGQREISRGDGQWDQVLS
jgi:hypothetical protein